MVEEDLPTDPDWIGCANGCGCAPTKGRDICIVCVVAEEGRCKRVEDGAREWEQLVFRETGT
jgi:hypothetical protein